MIDMADVAELIAQRVLLTVAYSAQFGFPLSRMEIHRRFFFPVFLKNQTPTKSVIKSTIKLATPNSFQDSVGKNGRFVNPIESKTTTFSRLPSTLIDLAIDQLVSTGCLDFDGKWYRLSFPRPERSYSHHFKSPGRARSSEFILGPSFDTGSSKSERPHSQIVNQHLTMISSKQKSGLPNYLNRQLLFKNSQKKRREAQPLINYLSQLSWVEGVAITGSLALNSADEKDDADFLIVTQPNRLWLTRLLVLYFAIKHGKRRSFAHEEPNSWCFNLWLDTNNLFVPITKHSLYTAYEVCQADWVINRHQTAQKFLAANSWVRQTLPGYYVYRCKQVKKFDYVNYKQSTVGRILSPVITLSSWAGYLLQLLYMLPHRTTERVGKGFAWFHPVKK